MIVCVCVFDTFSIKKLLLLLLFRGAVAVYIIIIISSSSSSIKFVITYDNMIIDILKLFLGYRGPWWPASIFPVWYDVMWSSTASVSVSSSSLSSSLSSSSWIYIAASLKLFHSNRTCWNYANVTCWVRMARHVIVNLLRPFTARILSYFKVKPPAKIKLFYCKSISHWNILFHAKIIIFLNKMTTWISPTFQHHFSSRYILWRCNHLPK